jgi:hypothetical protein
MENSQGQVEAGNIANGSKDGSRIELTPLVQDLVRRLEDLERKAAARRRARLNGSAAERKAEKPEPAEKGDGQGTDAKGVKEPAKRSNRGWFKAGDERINVLGRGLKRKPTLAEKAESWDGKEPCPVCGREPLPKSGRLMQHAVSEKELRGRLAMTTHDCAYLLTLPDDARIVAVELDPVRGEVFTYESEQFKALREGQPIPELRRHVQGMLHPQSW